MTSLRHVHFVQSVEPLQGGGLGAAAAQLHAQLASSGTSVLLTTKAGGVDAVADGVRQFALRGPARLFYAPGLARAAAELLVPGATVAHGHGLYVYPNYAVGRRAWQRGVPLVYHPHGMLEPWILARSRAKKQLAHWLFEDANFRSARLWRALTVREADQIRGLGLTAPVVVLPNGIEPAAFDFPVPRPLPQQDRRQILFLGRLHPKKGLPMLVAAWARLVTQARDWELVIAGPDENGHRAEVEAQVRAAGLTDTVQFRGAVTGEAKRNCWREAEVFVLPSHSEGFPMAVLEACAAGLPVVATDACNFPELKAAEAGWECPATVEGVTAALGEAIVASDVERRQRGERGRRLVETRYAWPGIAAALHAECVRLL